MEWWSSDIIINSGEDMVTWRPCNWLIFENDELPELRHYVVIERVKDVFTVYDNLKEPKSIEDTTTWMSPSKRVAAITFKMIYVNSVDTGHFPDFI